MSMQIGDRVLHRGTRRSGVVLSEPRAGRLDVRTSDDREEIWSLADIVLDSPGATNPHIQGRGHIADPHDGSLKG